MASTTQEAAVQKLVYWRRELPPLGEQIEGEHIVEADSPHLPIEHPQEYPHDDLWSRCAADLEATAAKRLEQEIRRLGGSCAHIVDENIEPKSDHATGTTWLHGRYTYVLYKH